MGSYSDLIVAAAPLSSRIPLSLRCGQLIVFLSSNDFSSVVAGTLTSSVFLSSRSSRLSLLGCAPRLCPCSRGRLVCRCWDVHLLCVPVLADVSSVAAGMCTSSVSQFSLTSRLSLLGCAPPLCPCSRGRLVCRCWDVHLLCVPVLADVSSVAAGMLMCRYPTWSGAVAFLLLIGANLMCTYVTCGQRTLWASASPADCRHFTR